ncbi:MAG: thymidylate synthase [Candidatus Vogelbacteria bacterium CG10_big_fil_rev_8_21_14_0_10_45_14]|uniref:Thymidylate synthase n=1 Tax=Candidatus Vogelbacteria bacterium CG10_big_fil_rev_8_21_14_0_10_45_14 TaxID=1975042 RepID=A0A2H0RNA8_9BACT|nr:MAG: thymidylate synthase [Candidatus Vogelbacteria bacterium CG10_big_fil_rev_8_21_14_0_10_45_14]
MHPEYQYLNLLRNILETGSRKVDKGTGDASYSLFGHQMRFDLSKGFPLLTTKKVYWRGVREELSWFIHGDNNVYNLCRKEVHIWCDYPFRYYKLAAERGEVSEMNKDVFKEKFESDDDFAKKWGVLPKVYGEMWRKWPTRSGRTIDQLSWAIKEIVEDESCHNAIVNAWNPEYLYNMASEEDASRFPICHNMYQLNVIDGRVSLHLYQRSADLFLGVPFNIASYSLLLHVVSKITGYAVGDFVHSFGDVHIYESHLEQVKEQLEREPTPLPTITISDDLKNIDDFALDKVKLKGYDPHPTLKGDLSVTGGYDEAQAKRRNL